MTQPTITVLIDGQHVPLAECAWLQRATCSCVVSVVTAVVPGAYVLATAEQAHEHLVPTKRERAKDVKEGLAWELVTMAHYRANIGKRWECAEHVRPAVDAQPAGGAR